MNTQDTIKEKVEELRKADYTDEEIMVLMMRAIMKAIDG